MKAWITYTTADEFAEDFVFREWVASGTYGLPEHPFTSFFADHAHLIPIANEAADLLRVTAFPDETLTAGQLKVQIDETWRKIRLRESNLATSPVRVIWYRWAVAAVLILIGGFAWMVVKDIDSKYVVSEKPLLRPDSWQVFTNRGTEVRPLSLSDGSMVWLEPGSELHFPQTFEADKREVVLTGEAFFEIYKNGKQPFFVKTQDLIARVAGTSFLIRTLGENKGTVVQVRTGKVWVSRLRPGQSEEEPVALQANQQLEISDRSGGLLAEPVTQPSVLSGRLDEQHFEFTDAPVPVVLEALSAAYGLPVEYDQAGFQNCQITTALTDEPLTEKLNILSETVGLGTRIELIDDKILVTGVGCR